MALPWVSIRCLPFSFYVVFFVTCHVCVLTTGMSTPPCGFSVIRSLGRVALFHLVLRPLLFQVTVCPITTHTYNLGVACLSASPAMQLGWRILRMQGIAVQASLHFTAILITRAPLLTTRVRDGGLGCRETACPGPGRRSSFHRRHPTAHMYILFVNLGYVRVSISLWHVSAVRLTFLHRSALISHSRVSSFLCYVVSQLPTIHDLPWSLLFLCCFCAILITQFLSIIHLMV